VAAAAVFFFFLAVAATVASIWAYRSQQEAIAERDRATQSFELAKRTADSLVTDIVGGLRNVPGVPAETVRQILETAKVTFEQLAASEPDYSELHRSQSLMLDAFGDTYYSLEGKLEEALRNYRDSLAIRERLAAADPASSQTQGDLSVSYNRVGTALRAMGRLEEALKAHRDSLAIRDRLATADRSNKDWQRDLSVSYKQVGELLKAQAKLEEAFKAYRDSLAIDERLVAANPSNTMWRRDLQSSIGRIGGLAHELVLAHDFTRALEASDLVISIASDEIWLYTNRAHALMFLTHVDEARALYLQFRGQKNVAGDDKSWETVVLEDFAELRKAGLTHPLMDEIEKRFAAGH
jgi:tetratricopeptide (TPR) repeat protein